MNLTDQIKAPISDTLEAMFGVIEDYVPAGEREGLMVAIDQMIGRLDQIVQRIASYEPKEETPEPKEAVQSKTVGRGKSDKPSKL
jgi:hypothetical protein